METMLKEGDIVQFGRDEAIVKEIVPSREMVGILRLTGASRGIPKFVRPAEVTFLRSGPVTRPPQPPRNTPPTQAPKQPPEPVAPVRQSIEATGQLGLF